MQELDVIKVFGGKRFRDACQVLIVHKFKNFGGPVFCWLTFRFIFVVDVKDEAHDDIVADQIAKYVLEVCQATFYDKIWQGRQTVHRSRAVGNLSSVVEKRENFPDYFWQIGNDNFVRKWRHNFGETYQGATVNVCVEVVTDDAEKASKNCWRMFRKMRAVSDWFDSKRWQALKCNKFQNQLVLTTFFVFFTKRHVSLVRIQYIVY